MSEGFAFVCFTAFIALLLHSANKSYHEDLKTYYKICEVSSSNCSEYPYTKFEMQDIIKGNLIKSNQEFKMFKTTAAAANAFRKSKNK